MKIYFAGNLAEPREKALKKVCGGRGLIQRLVSFYYLEWFKITKKVLFE